MDYPVQFASQVQQLLKSLRKSHKLTQAELARRLGVVQSRIADIERDPGAVSLAQLLQVLGLLGTQMVLREIADDPAAVAASSGSPQIQAPTHRRAPGSTRTSPTPPDSLADDEPRGQW